MSRSIKKGPYVDAKVMKKVTALKKSGKKDPITTWARACTIVPDFVGVMFMVHNGNKFIPVNISEEMVGHKLGEFAPTRTFRAHSAADKKATKAPTP